MARSMLKEMKVPPLMWGEAIRHAVYVLNRLPTRSLTGQTPYEAWFKKKPFVDYLCVFGCIAHVKIPSIHVTKLDDRSKQMVHLGREPGTKAYRLYDPSTEKITVSRDVVFDETQGWKWNESTPEIFVYSTGVFAWTDQNDEETVDSEASPNTPSGDSTPLSPSSPFSVSPATSRSESTTTSILSPESTAPLKYRSLNDVYDNIETVELADELLLLGVDDPVTYEQAVKDKSWRDTMQTEIAAIEKNDTWVLTDLPQGHNAIALKWVFKLKKDTNGEVTKHKARLVVKRSLPQ